LARSTDLIDPGSFRDPSGHVFHYRNRVFRALSRRGDEAFRPVLDSGLLTDWESRGVAVTTREVGADELPEEVFEHLPFAPASVLEHSRIGHLSYPYEWPFALLKSAALLHLDLQIEALSAGFSFSDSSAYNIQFVGSEPVLMDVLSVRPYKDGEYWAGYRQFCEQFLNPLLLTAKVGVPFGPWYRGSLNGIGVEQIAKLLPLSGRLSFNAMMHITLHAKLMRSAHRLKSGSEQATLRKMPKAGLTAMLSGMRSWVSSLKPKGFDDTFWADYEKKNSYAPEQASRKKQFVSDYVGDTKPDLLFDLGCNSGDYSEVALVSGAKSVVGFDFDEGALAAAVSRSKAKSLALLPLFLDISNPSPDQGWRQLERKGFLGRSGPDGVIALALIHHLVIGANIPLRQAVDWLVRIAPTGIIEFVPKQDPMVLGMLSNREDIFDDYHLGTFRDLLDRTAEIVAVAEVSNNGRALFRYRARK
jgi:ribosomal protein L11 methylase PrmA